MLTNVLIPPGMEAPADAGRAFAVAGGWLLACNDAGEEQVHRWRYADGLEVWQAEKRTQLLTAHVYGCSGFDAFKDLCTDLAMQCLGVTEVHTHGDCIRLGLCGEADARQMTVRLRPLAMRLAMDVALTGPDTPSLSRPGLLFMDMDSTLITCESIDELAGFLGIKEKVADITQRTMEGELDFAASLTERVKLLAGLDAGVLDRVYDEQMRLNDGAEKLIEAVHARGWKVGLVSGGFTYFTDKLKTRLNLDYTQSNVLEIEDGKLTGKVLGDVVDAQSKREALLAQANVWNIPMEQTVAIGDGANDLPMLEAAALGIAFHAKPKVCELAPYAITRGGLDRILDLLS